jgi:hypothetical protein
MKLTDWLLVVVGLLQFEAIVGQIIIYRRQAEIMGQQRGIAERTLVLTQRPRIRVRHISLDRPERSAFYAGSHLDGKFEIVNAGGAKAQVRVWRCHILIGRSGGPPPWPITSPSEYETNLPTLEPGVYAELRFKRQDGLSDEDATNLRGLAQGITLYVIGRITYEDDLHISRTTQFCRYWAMPQGTYVARFYRSDDPDFEYED